MPNKKEKIIEQVFEADFINEDKQPPLLKGFTFLENIKFHSVVLCESKDKERRERRIVLLPRHMKELLNSLDEKLNEERDIFANARNKFVKERKRFAQERRSFANERRKLQKEIEKLENENKALSEQNDALNTANDQLRMNIKDKSLKEWDRPKYPSGYSSVFDDAAPQLRGRAMPGGSPGLGKK